MHFFGWISIFELGSKITSAVTYSLIVLMTSLGAVFFMLKFVVPMFADVFERFGGELPWITSVIILFLGF